MRKIISAGMTVLSLTFGVPYAIAADNTKPERTAGQVVDDATITTKVKAALIGDELTKARNINVDTHKGVVTLTGTVDTATEKARASTVARSVEGVSSVHNNLATK